MATGLAASGVQPGDVVQFQLFNSPEFVMAYLASHRLGAIASPINFRFSPGETAHVLSDSQPRVLIYDARFARNITEVVALSTFRPDLLIEVSSSLQDYTGSAMPFSELLTSTSEVPSLPKAETWDESTRLYTSGTTGMPKGVSLPGLSEVLTAHDVIMHFPLGPEDKTLNMTPWFHRGGISPWRSKRGVLRWRVSGCDGAL